MTAHPTNQQQETRMSSEDTSPAGEQPTEGEQTGQLTRLHWKHPVIGDIAEIVCPAHHRDVRSALAVLGIGSLASDGSAAIAGADGPGELPVCLRCQAHPAMPPRQLLRQWFGGDQS